MAILFWSMRLSLLTFYLSIEDLNKAFFSISKHEAIKIVKRLFLLTFSSDINGAESMVALWTTLIGIRLVFSWE